tara:strand:+ start:380 stop:541 length:162 start_codon:yes stop_codon:yes gene_type:complete
MSFLKILTCENNKEEKETNAKSKNNVNLHTVSFNNELAGLFISTITCINQQTI